ncbi:MAG: hypothetical protein GY742_20375 [Hyphomicrobiales bacterium]|nr:hypothetical protein [Hyphomicrobiales bacterium]
MTATITAIGVDPAKIVFQVHCTDNNGNPVLKKRLRSARNLPCQQTPKIGQTIQCSHEKV